MNTQIARAASLGIAVLGTQIVTDDVHAAAIGAQNSAADYSAFIGSDDSLDTKAMLEANTASVFDSSGCVNVAADTSGLFGWYSEPVVIPHAAFAATEAMGQEIASAGNTLALLSNFRVAIFENNAQNIPEFQTLTPGDANGPFRQVAVAPNGLEVAVSDATGYLTFYRRDPVSGWQAAEAAQVFAPVPGSSQPLTGKALAYSSDGTQLFVDLQGQSSGVRIFERGVDGDWVVSAKIVPGKFTSVNERIVGWSADRLLVSDQDALLVYKRGTGDFEFSHAISLGGVPTKINVFGDNFSISTLGAVTFYRFNGLRFDRAFTRFQPLADVAVIDATNFPSGPLFAAADPGAAGACGRLRFLFANFPPALGTFVLPDRVPSIVNGPWGVIATTISASGTGEIYIVARDRIFGGQNPPLGTFSPGQGSFE